MECDNEAADWAPGSKIIFCVIISSASNVTPLLPTPI